EREIKSYRHIDGDIRDAERMNWLFAQYGSAIAAVIHTAAQPSHDWAARNPQVDFKVYASGTMYVIEVTHLHFHVVVFMFDRYNLTHVRVIILSFNLDNAFCHFIKEPRSSAMYNHCGHRQSNVSMLEAIASRERHTGRPMN